MIEKLTSENLSDFIDNYPTKHKYGFLGSETDAILEKFEIDKEKFYTALGVNTCMIIEGEILNYHCDIELALRCVIEDRDKTLDEWD
ncbi:MAG: hypothetical protein E6R13_08410 [Spirochaetes bacterium]|nr:MAG: hypothetical protein E6R13_08410 [Spirochaetota bacterium]